MHAAYKGNLEIVELVVNSKANLETKSKVYSWECMGMCACECVCARSIYGSGGVYVYGCMCMWSAWLYVYVHGACAKSIVGVYWCRCICMRACVEYAYRIDCGVAVGVRVRIKVTAPRVFSG